MEHLAHEGHRPNIDYLLFATAANGNVYHTFFLLLRCYFLINFICGSSYLVWGCFLHMPYSISFSRRRFNLFFCIRCSRCLKLCICISVIRNRLHMRIVDGAYGKMTSVVCSVVLAKTLYIKIHRYKTGRCIKPKMVVRELDRE